MTEVELGTLGDGGFRIDGAAVEDQSPAGPSRARAT